MPAPRLGKEWLIGLGVYWGGRGCGKADWAKSLHFLIPVSLLPPIPPQARSDPLIPGPGPVRCEFHVTVPPPANRSKRSSAPSGGRSSLMEGHAPVRLLCPTAKIKMLQTSGHSSTTEQRSQRTESVTANSWRHLLWVAVGWEEKQPGLQDFIYSAQLCSNTERGPYACTTTSFSIPGLTLSSSFFLV